MMRHRFHLSCRTPSHSGCFTLELESDFVPAVGMNVDPDGQGEAAFLIEYISWHPHDNTLWVTLEEDVRDSDKTDPVEEYTGYGWKLDGEWFRH